MKQSVVVYHNLRNLPENEILNVVIWLHGLGADGHDFVSIVPELGLKKATKFVFPHAPNLAVTINGGYVMPAWYDIYEMDDIERKVDDAQINRSSNRVIEMIEWHVAKGVPLANIIVAGFSQGGAIAYHSALSLAKRNHFLGGVLALSTYFPTAKDFASVDFTSHDLPILIHHGAYDDVVSPMLGQYVHSQLQQLGFAPIFQSYPMAHQLCQAQIGDIGQWLNERFGA